MLSTAMSKRLDAYFSDYAAYHRTRGNKICHYIGIPLIAITLLGLLAEIRILPAHIPGGEIARLDGGILLLALAGLWYLTLDWKLAVPFTLFGLGMYFFGRALPMLWLWTFFVLGWVFQGIGHYVYEKKSPAFLKNLKHILIGPLWIFADWIGHPSESSRRS